MLEFYNLSLVVFKSKMTTNLTRIHNSTSWWCTGYLSRSFTLTKMCEMLELGTLSQKKNKRKSCPRSL